MNTYFLCDPLSMLPPFRPVQFKNLDWGSGLFRGDETERQIDRSGSCSI